MYDPEIYKAELKRGIDALRVDYASVTGKPFDHFFCPILMRDEPAEMCKGHIVNKALGNCGAWVPQRKDVDNFFGLTVESDLVTILRNRDKKLRDILRVPKKPRGIKPKLLENGRPIEYYYPNGDSQKVEGQTFLNLIDNGGLICNLAIKKPADYLVSIPDSALQFLIDVDFWPQVTASVIKAAHLTLFKMFRYRHVFSPTGIYLASILRDFFEKLKPPAKCEEADVASHFRQFETMVAPIIKCDHLAGTIRDNRLLSVFDNRDRIFAMGVAINAGPDMFCVFVPGVGVAIDTYFSFLKVPPPSIAVKLTQWLPGTGEKESHFQIPDGDPGRFFFPTGSRSCEDFPGE